MIKKKKRLKKNCKIWDTFVGEVGRTVSLPLFLIQPTQRQTHHFFREFYNKRSGLSSQYEHTKFLHNSVHVKKFVVRADDLIQLKERGRGAYGVVYEMQHQETGTIMAVKVPTVQCYVCITITFMCCYLVLEADF